MPKGIYDRSKRRAKRVAVTFRDNFWSKKRVEQNVTIDEIAELLEINKKTASAYFTGQLVPHEYQIKTLCEYFGVDIIEGTREFYNAHKHYDATHKRTLKLSAKTQKKIEEATKEEPAWNDEPTPVEKVAEKIREQEEAYKRLVESPYDPNKIVELLYGKIPFMLFNEVYVALERGLRVDEIIYGKIDYEIYCKVLELEKRW